MLFGVDAGGSKTTILAELHDGNARALELPSINPAAVGHDAAATTLAELFHHLSSLSARRPVVGWIGSASLTADSLQQVGTVMRSAAEAAHVTGRVTVTEDGTTLLLAPPLDGVGLVSVVGTGTITLGRSGDGHVVQCGGYEYLVDDEGSGFDLGLHGLRAAGRAYDGRGPATMLLNRAREVYGMDIPALGVQLATTPFPKQVVARFAHSVCAAAEAGDAIAIGLVERAVQHIVQTISAARRSLPDPPIDVVLAGGLAAGGSYYAQRLHSGVENSDAGLRAHAITEPVRCALALARQDRADAAPPALDAFPHLRLQFPQAGG